MRWANPAILAAAAVAAVAFGPSANPHMGEQPDGPIIIPTRQTMRGLQR